jgi:hypothetical protein
MVLPCRGVTVSKICPSLKTSPCQWKCDARTYRISTPNDTPSQKNPQARRSHTPKPADNVLSQALTGPTHATAASKPFTCSGMGSATLTDRLAAAAAAASIPAGTTRYLRSSEVVFGPIF